ncbi:MAG TPA: lamin tail domain-containing protein [Anaerolineaceae bacterium]|nr:lamin tail domain-containing protein [Anaerolineaceae bacterium]
MKRWIPFLILNILVSAITTLLVLRWWDQNHRAQSLLPATTPVTEGLVSSVTPQPQPDPVLPSLDEEWMQVDTVIGAGDLNNEVVVFARVGEGDLRLTGWQVVDENRNRFTFPDLLLNTNGAVRLYSRAGEDSVMELYWDLDEAVWSSGELVTLLDPEGNTRATYQIP